MFTFRWAESADLPAVSVLMDRAIATLQKGFLSPAEIAASKSVMGQDTPLISKRDGRLGQIALARYEDAARQAGSVRRI